VSFVFHELEDTSRYDLDMLDVEDKHCILRDVRKFLVTVTQVRTGSESAGAACTHSLKAIPKARNDVAVSYLLGFVTVIRQEVATIKLDIVTNAHSVAFFQLRAGSMGLSDNLDA
jgi:hypothetical protein